MHFTTILITLATAIGASAAPANELQTRASNIKLAKIAGKWQIGWQGATTVQQYTCSNNGLLNILNLNCVSVLNGATVSVPISILGAGSLSSILASLGLSGVGTGTGGVGTGGVGTGGVGTGGVGTGGTGTGTGGTGTGTGGTGTTPLTPAQCLLCSACSVISI